MKIIYHYDPITFVYLGTSEADHDPVVNPLRDEEGAFILPANATFTKPPLPMDGSAIVYINNRWGYVHVAHLDEEPSETPAAPTGTQVNAERDRRTDAGFIFEGAVYQSAPANREDIAGASTAALAAIMLGTGTPGNYRWSDPDVDFAWITADNRSIVMDAPTTFRLGQKAMSHKSRHIFAAFALKRMEPIPYAFVDDQYWPANENALPE